MCRERSEHGHGAEEKREVSKSDAGSRCGLDKNDAQLATKPRQERIRSSESGIREGWIQVRP